VFGVVVNESLIPSKPKLRRPIRRAMFERVGDKIGGDLGDTLRMTIEQAAKWSRPLAIFYFVAGICERPTQFYK
jgi:hypothetical protein